MLFELVAYDGMNPAILSVDAQLGVIGFPQFYSRQYNYPTYTGSANCPMATICEHAPAGSTVEHELIKPAAGAQGTLIQR